MNKIVFATENPGKLREISQFARNFGYEILSPSQAGFQPVDVEETGSTYQENARLKVEAYSKQAAASSWIICGDDSGIEIKALNNEPGIHSRRWLGYSMSDDEIVGYTLGRMHGAEDRRAEFKSTVAYSMNGGDTKYVTGVMRGEIVNLPLADAPKQVGFPFRQLFIVDTEGQIPLWKFDELKLDERRGVYSHRESAFKELFEMLEGGHGQ